MKLGQTEATGTVGHRDAFHVASVLVRSSEKLKPGDDVRFTDDRYVLVVKATKDDRHAIVDPFVDEITPGDLFWALLIPNLTSNLAHHFNINANVPFEMSYEEDDDGCRGCV